MSPNQFTTSAFAHFLSILHIETNKIPPPAPAKCKSNHDIPFPNTLQWIFTAHQGEKDKVLTIVYKALLIGSLIHYLSLPITPLLFS